MDLKRLNKAIKKRLYQYSLFYPKKSQDAFRWGIIGLGNMAEVFATALDDDKDSIIAAVASRSLDKALTFATRHGHCNAYGSYEEMLNDTTLNLDVVYIATPVKYHAEHIKLCLEAGKNVLCEKPITTNAIELKSLKALAEEKHLFLMEGMWMKCLPTFCKAKEWFESGLIGQLQLIKVDFYKREFIDPKLSIFNAAEGGGVMRDYGVYAISFITSFLGGEPDGIQYEVRKSSLNIDADWQLSAKRNGIKAFVSLSSNYQGLSKAALIGTKGVIEWDAQFNRSNRIVRYDELGKQQEEYSMAYHSEGFEYEIAEVRHCVRAGRKESDIVNMNDSLATIQLIDKLTCTK